MFYRNFFYFTLPFSFISTIKAECLSPQEKRSSYDDIVIEADWTPDQITKLGTQTLFGINGIPKNPELAFQYFELATQYEKGDPEATSRIGEFFLYGWGGKIRSEERAIECFKEAAKRGDSLAEAHLGEYYLKQKSMFVDYETKAIDYLERAYQKGANGLACTYLGELALRGTKPGVFKGPRYPVNVNRAISFFSYAGITLGDPRGKARLAEAHLNGLGGLQRDEEIIEHYLQDALIYNQGLAEAIYGVYLYEKKNWTKNDRVLALQYLAEAQRLGEITPRGLVYLIHARCNNLWGQQKNTDACVIPVPTPGETDPVLHVFYAGSLYNENPKKSFSLMKQYAELGNSIAQGILSGAYFAFYSTFSDYVTLDDKKAIELATKVLENDPNEFSASMVFGIAKWHGAGGLEVSRESAVAIFQKQIELEQPRLSCANFYLSLAYEFGVGGVAVDLEKAQSFAEQSNCWDTRKARQALELEQQKSKPKAK